MSQSNQNKRPSIFTILFMPQIGLSLQGLSHIVPVFMRTLAVMFAQAGLIPENHPAINYGAQGVGRYGLGRLMGEAWVTLRTTRATIYQWGVFSSIVLMISIVAATILTALLTLASGFGTQAHAQLFSMTGKQTDEASTITQYPAANPAVLFDKSIPPAATGAGDFGIMLLDKVVRQGAYGHGGTFQTSMRAAFNTYNSAVLVVAGIMLFWSILAVVVDTAKTGQIGGGRHNMVWAPIRIVFALSLMIPLGGSVGFSSGQFMVMKLAEWGSNLASNTWTDYVTAAAGGSKLVVGQNTQNPSELINQYQKIWLCRISYNAAQLQQSPTTPDSQLVDDTMAQNTPLGTVVFTHTADNSGSLCGTVTAADPSADESLTAVIQDPDSDLMAKQVAASTGLAQATAAGFFVNIAETYINAAGTPVNLPSTYYAGFTQVAQQFACAFAGNFIFDASGTTFPMTTNRVVDPSSNQGCLQGWLTMFGANPGPNNAVLPDSTGMQGMVNTFTTAYQGALDQVVLDMNAALASAAINDANNRGWTVMGSWFNRITIANDTVNKNLPPAVQITDGSLVQASYNAGGSDVEATVAEIMAKYNSWWTNLAKVQGNVSTMNANNGAAAGRQTTSNTSLVSNMSNSANGSVSASGTIAAMQDIVNPKDVPMFIHLIEEDPNVYPMTTLAATGADLYNAGWAMTLGMTGLQIGLALLPSFCGSAIVASACETVSNVGLILTQTALGHLIVTAGTAILMAGMVLKYWVPLIPFVRTAFSVLTWIISVFEAVAMVPIAALAHLHTEGDGLAGGARTVWILWLNVLLRPVVTVIAFIGTITVFNAFVLYFDQTFTKISAAVWDQQGSFDIGGTVMYTVIYVAMIYTLANTVFKMLDLVPNGIMRWLGGSPDHTLDDHGTVAGLMSAAGQQVSQASRQMLMSKEQTDGIKGAATKKTDITPNDTPPASTQSANNQADAFRNNDPFDNSDMD